MNITRLCLIRHGETNWNAERRLQGHTDTPLNEHGQAQARLMARALKNTQLEFDALYSSNLQRAVDTAHAVTELLNIPATAMSELRERHFGVLQGLTITEAPWPNLKFGKHTSIASLIMIWKVARVLLYLLIESPPP